MEGGRGGRGLGEGGEEGGGLERVGEDGGLTLTLGEEEWIPDGAGERREGLRGRTEVGQTWGCTVCVLSLTLPPAPPDLGAVQGRGPRRRDVRQPRRPGVWEPREEPHSVRLQLRQRNPFQDVR